MRLAFGSLTDSPLGPISMVAGEQGLQLVKFGFDDALQETLKISDPDVSMGGFETLCAALIEINEYLFGDRKSFSFAINWDVLGDFQRLVLAETNQIPFGQVMTYGEVAARIGKPGAARAVGRALSANPMPIVIPCHRVIGTGRNLRGYAGGLQSKAFLLRLEGHVLDGDRIIAA